MSSKRVPTLARGVTVRENRLSDPALGLEIPLAVDQQAIIKRILLGCTVNLKEHELRLVEVLGEFGIVTGIDGLTRSRSKRITIPGRSLSAIVVRITAAVVGHLWWVLATWVIVYLLMVIAGYGGLRPLVQLSVPTVATVVGIALHEAGHLYVVRRIAGNWHLGVLIVGGLGLYIARPESQQGERAIAAAGPLLPAVVGLAVCLAGLLASEQLLLIASVFLGVHILGLTPVFADGKAFWRGSVRAVPGCVPGAGRRGGNGPRK